MNRFDKPVEGQYVSQYVPIPFEQLYQLGKYYNEEVDKAQQELASSVNKWSEFRSPSAIDTKQWYDYTIGGAKQIVDEMINNPDLIKTAEGRSKITSFINSRPYDKLSSLQQSREAMLERQKANQTLALNGKYNPLWHDVNFTEYDTMQGGIFKDTAPLAFKSVNDLTKPYVDDLKNQFIATKGGYDYFGVTPERALSQVTSNFASIYNTPEAQKHIQTLMGQGLTQDEAIQTFKGMVSTAAMEQATYDRRPNEFAKINYEYAKRAALANTGQPGGGGPFYITQAMEVTGKDLFGQRARAALAQSNPEYKKALDESISPDPIIANQAKDRIREIDKTVNPNMLFRSIFSSYGKKTDNGKIQLTNQDLNLATNHILNNFSYKVTGEAARLFEDKISGITSKESPTLFGQRRILNGGEDLTLTTRYVANIAGYNAVDPGRNKVENALKSGKLVGMVVLDNNNIMSIPTAEGSTVNTQNLKVAVPVSTVKNAGLDYGEMVRAGGQYIKNPNYVASSYTNKKKKGETESETEREQYKGEEGYYIINLSSNLPSTGDGLPAEYLNQEALSNIIGQSKSSELYPDVQNTSWGFKK